MLLRPKKECRAQQVHSVLHHDSFHPVEAEFVQRHFPQFIKKFLEATRQTRQNEFALGRIRVCPDVLYVTRRTSFVSRQTVFHATDFKEPGSNNCPLDGGKD